MRIMIHFLWLHRFSETICASCFCTNFQSTMAKFSGLCYAVAKVKVYHLMCGVIYWGLLAVDPNPQLRYHSIKLGMKYGDTQRSRDFCLVRRYLKQFTLASQDFVCFLSNFQEK